MSLKRKLGGVFVLLLLSVLSVVYYIVVILNYVPIAAGIYYSDDGCIKLWMIFLHLTLGMFLWTFFKAILTDPGKVPQYWGFYMGDAEFKRRRYCLLCHVFKPERTHHCSVCNRCVLNMDHHCPWINNCVGFHNRKIFILLLLYGLINLYQILLLMLPIAYSDLVNLVNVQQSSLQLPYINIGITVLVLCLSLLLSMFSKFHFQLVYENSTTIEKADASLPVGLYDKGLRFNWMQIFGQDVRIWLLPIYGRTGLPLGDGVVWQTKSEDSEVKQPSERSSEGTVRTPKRVSGLPNDMMNLRQTSEAYRQIQPSFVKSDVDTDTSFLTPNKV